MSYGFEKAGVNILLGIDNDAMALKAFEHNHKASVTICSDITNIHYDEIEEKIGDKKLILLSVNRLVKACPYPN